jgi:transposase
MKTYQNFVGIDIGKFNFVVAAHGTKTTVEYENSSAGIGEFMAAHKDILSNNAFCVVEATGGYEQALINSFLGAKYPIHRADTRKVKSFIRSFGHAAKTDKLDAKALALYGYERSHLLECFKAKSEESVELFQLVQRRNDLKQMLVAEKNRKQAPLTSASDLIQNGVTAIVTLLSEQITLITEEITRYINLNPVMKAQHEVLKTIPGIGNIVAFELLVLLPELGQLTRRQIASLAGLAPRANDSGRFQGYRRTGHGRAGVKPILFMAAMAARNSKSSLNIFYEQLIGRGKKKLVALTALMRKILVIANARLKSLDLKMVEQIT